MRIHEFALATALLAMAAWSQETTAHAEGALEAKDAAQKLYDEATSAMDGGDFATACPKLERVTELVPEGLGARLTLAECYEASGKLATALAQYRALEPVLVRAGQSDRLKKTKDEIEALAPRVATLTLELSNELRETPGLEIRVDGVVVSEVLRELPMKLDTGLHHLGISAPGRRSQTQEIVITRDGEKTIASIPPLSPLPAPPREPIETRGPKWQLPTGIAFMAGGAVTAGVGLGLGAVALSRRSAAGAECSAALVCSAAGMKLRSDGRMFANAATALLVVGGVSAGAGIVIAATSSSTRSTTKTGPTAALTLGPLAFDVRGDF